MAQMYRWQLSRHAIPVKVHHLRPAALIPAPPISAAGAATVVYGG